MKRQSLILLTILTTLNSCDFSQRINDTVDDGIKDAKVEMSTDISNAKLDFKESFNLILTQTKDSKLLDNVTNLYLTVTRTSKYIDSLRIEIDKLDDMDIKNVEFIKRMFLYDGIGDSVFTQIKYSYFLAIDIAIADSTKARLRSVKDKYSEETKKQFFGVNGPLGVNMILFGIESELIKDVTSCLAGHSKK